MATITFIPTDITPHHRKAYRLNLAAVLDELVDTQHVSRPDDLARFLELHQEAVEVLEGEFVPGGRYTLVVANFDDFSAYGYLDGETYHWSTITHQDWAGVIHTAPATYRDIIYTEDGAVNAHLGFLQTPHGLYTAVDAIPLLEQYTIVDPRFTLMQNTITPFTHNTPHRWAFDLCYTALTQINDNLKQGNSIYQIGLRGHPTQWGGIVETLRRHRFSTLSSSLKHLEAVNTDQATVELCLAKLTDPSVTYDEELWLHNVCQLELLFNHFAN